MSNYIVLVKQVPDVSQITDNAFDPESGTLIRTRLASVINELDSQALALANRMLQLQGGAGKVVCLTMGPPMAEEVLRYGLSRSADSAVLLTDRALGGADTYATANPLAFAIRKITKEMFAGDDDYYVVCGMQSVDGDTAQVPPQIAEELGLPCIAYVTGVEWKNGRFEYTRIITGGSEVVAAKAKPAVITTAKYEYPLFASFAGRRRANDIKVTCWTADDVKATALGAGGSKTRVIRVFPPGKTTRKCQHVTDAATLAKLIAKEFRAKAEKSKAGGADGSDYVLPEKRKSFFDRSYEVTDKQCEEFAALEEILKRLGVLNVDQIDASVKAKIAEADKRFHEKTLDAIIEGLKENQKPQSGEVWVVAEHRDKVISAATFELIGKGRSLADSLGTKVGVVLAGFEVGGLCQELAEAGADNVYLTDNKMLKQFDPRAYRKAVASAIDTYKPQIVLFAATPQGRVLAPMVSYSVHCGLTADCTSLEIKDNSRKGQIGVLLQTRPALGGNVMASICTKDSFSQMATARPGVMKRLEPNKARKANVIVCNVELSAADVSEEVISTELGAGTVNFHAPVIVSGGKGMVSRDNYEAMAGQLCDAIAAGLGTEVEKGATRAAVEQGFTERIRQVGQTGTAVGPKLYVALGISGAIQHMIGVANTETIVAVNSDPHAPIFKQCDYYIVGKIEDVVPQLVNAFEGLK